jgi:hypothetical protein
MYTVNLRYHRVKMPVGIHDQRASQLHIDLPLKSNGAISVDLPTCLPKTRIYYTAGFDSTGIAPQVWAAYSPRSSQLQDSRLASLR